jgi:hypothetical protein
MKLPILYKRTKNLSIAYWEIETEAVLGSDEYQVIKTSGQYGTDKPLVNIKTISEGKNLNRSNATTPQQQAESEARSDWKKKQDEGYKSLEDLGISWVEGTAASAFSYENTLYSHLKNALEAALPTFNTDANGMRKPMLAQSVKWNKVKYRCLVQPKLDGCVYGKTLVSTNKGLISIEEIVETKMKVEVLSYNEAKKVFEYKPITNWFNNGSSKYKDWLDVTLPTGTRLKTTANHKYFTNQGWKEARDLNEKEDLIYVNCFSEYRTSLVFGTLLGDSIMNIEKRGSGTSYRLAFSHTNKELFDFKVKTLNLDGRCTEYTTGYGSKGYRFDSVALSKTDFPIELIYFTGHCKRLGHRKHITYDNMCKYMSPEALSLWIADDGSISFNNGNPNTPVLSISTHKHSLDQIKVFVEYFQKKWHCTPTEIRDKRVDTTNCSGIFLQFNTKDTLYLLNSLRKCHCKGVEYKYYFPTEDYVQAAKDEFAWSKFHKTKAKRSSAPYTKYDLEVEDNHNYVANGVVIHNCRALAVFDGKTVTFLSRTGKKYTTLGHIKKELEEKLTQPVILDGEIFTRELTFQEIVSAVKKQQEQSLQLEFWVYDIVNDQKQLERELEVRRLTSTISWQHVKALPTSTCDNKEEVMELHMHYVSEGYEGVMIRLLNGTYDQGQRSSNLLKVKEYDTNEFVFERFLLGQRGVEDLIAECSTCIGLVFKAKMQGTVAQKQEVYDNPPESQTLITIKHHGYTDDGLPRFPIGVAFRDYE